MSLEEFARMVNNRHITTSTAYSGIGCSEIADQIVQNIVRATLGTHGLAAASAVSFEPLWAC
eukprot:5583356-Lingulodinium_polyedra.AAC.1